MQGHLLSASLSQFADLLRRWVVTLGQLQAPSRGADCDAYAQLARLRRQRAATRQCSNVIPFPHYPGDAHIKLRITM